MSQPPNIPSPHEPGNNIPPEGQNPQGAAPSSPYGQPTDPQNAPPAGAYPPPAQGGFPPPPPVQQGGAPNPGYGAPNQGYGAPNPGYGQPNTGYQPVHTAQAPSVGEAFNWGWLKFTQNLGAMVLGVLAMMVPAVIGFIIILAATYSATGSVLRGGSGAGSWFLMFIGIVIVVLGMFLVQLGVYRASLDISQGRTVTFGTFFQFQDIGKVILAALLLGGAVIVAGIVTFFLGGLGALVVAFFGQFTLLFVLDKSLAPIDAMKASMSLVNKNLGTVVILYLAVAIASGIGGFFLGVGLLVALPVTMLATAYMYRKLQGEPVAA